jgi:hypothetical protein
MTCSYETREVAGAGDWLAHNQRSRIRILSSLPAERVRRASPLAVVMPLVNTDRLVSSRRYLMVQQRQRRVCMFGSLNSSDRSSGLRSFGLSEADHSGILSGSRPMQQRLVCVEAGQTFSIQRTEVLTPQVSGIHCRLTRGRSLVRNQPGPLPDHSPLASAPPSPEHDSDGERSDE